jgi:hypothetical protein
MLNYIGIILVAIVICYLWWKIILDAPKRRTVSLHFEYEGTFYLQFKDGKTYFKDNQDTCWRDTDTGDYVGVNKYRYLDNIKILIDKNITVKDNTYWA